MYSLIVSLAEGLKTKYDLNKSFTIGRGSANDIVIPCNFISRCHCTLIYTQDEDNNNRYFLIRDGHLFGDPSTNGTWVNNARITGNFRLKNQDLITFGNVQLYPHAVFTDDCVNNDSEDSKITSGYERAII